MEINNSIYILGTYSLCLTFMQQGFSSASFRLFLLWAIVNIISKIKLSEHKICFLKAGRDITWNHTQFVHVQVRKRIETLGWVVNIRRVTKLVKFTTP